MNCQSFENVVNELARDQIMDASTRDQAILHSEGCKPCAVKLDEERKLDQSLKQLAAAMRTMHAPVNIEENLLVEFRTLKPGNKVARPSASRFSWQHAAAAAFLMTLCGAAAVWWAVTERPAAQQTVATVKQNEPPEVKDKAPTPTPPSNGGVSDEKARPAPSPRRESKRSPKTSSPSKGVHRLRNLEAVAVNRPAMSQEAEITTDFLPIGYTGVQNVQEGGQLIRVELPRYAMARFGLPVNMDRMDERVKADVLFGADGLARAIRFVQ